MTEPTLPAAPDDADEGWGEPSYGESDDDAAQRLEQDRPPHHDRD